MTGGLFERSDQTRQQTGKGATRLEEEDREKGRMVDPPEDNGHTTARRPRRMASQGGIDYRSLHRGLCSSPSDAREEAGKTTRTAARAKESAMQTTATPGDNTPQMQMLLQILHHITSIDKQMKQGEERAKVIEERLKQLEEQVAKMPTMEQITSIIQEL